VQATESKRYIIAYDDEFDSKPGLQNFINAIRRGSGFDPVKGQPGLVVEQYWDPEKLIAEIASADRRAPALLVLDIATQATGRRIDGEVNGGFAVARAAVEAWPGVPLIFLTSYVSDSFRKFTAGGFEGYEDYIGKGGPWAIPTLEQSVKRVCGGTQKITSGRLTIDPQRNELWWEGKPVKTLTLSEFRMADCITQACLVLRKDMATSREILLSLRNGSDDPNSLHPAMARLKAKISEVAGYKIGPKDLFQAIGAHPHDGKIGGYALVER
jgi:DNA-binding response OmpR family regulator